MSATRPAGRVQHKPSAKNDEKEHQDDPSSLHKSAEATRDQEYNGEHSSQSNQAEKVLRQGSKGPKGVQ